jgi:DNA-binding MarR family transcriptional regulator
MENIFDHQDIQHRVWINWYHSGVLVAKYTDISLIKVRGMTYQQFLVLTMMKKFGEKATATEIAKLLDKNNNTLGTILDRMEKKGLVKKIRDTEDRRLVRAIMTPKGEEKLAATTKAILVVFEKLTSCFSKEELKKFDTLLEKLTKNTDKLVHPHQHDKKVSVHRF